MHCGYIGQGMLSGACPAKFSPHRRPIKSLNARWQIDGGEGVLSIIKNYTGDIQTLKQRPSH
ncbi:dihydroxyacetone kinase subunit DhaK [Shigella flexneri]